jgi:hypothetical protein
MVSQIVWLARSRIVSILCVWITVLRREEKSCCTMSLWKLAMVLVEDGNDERNMIAERCFPTLLRSQDSIVGCAKTM